MMLGWDWVSAQPGVAWCDGGGGGRRDYRIMRTRGRRRREILVTGSFEHGGAGRTPSLGPQSPSPGITNLVSP